MIDWIHQRCKDWGDSRYYIDNGTSHPTSIFGRMDQGWNLASADPAQRPDPPEVMLGDALAISIAIRSAINAKHMTERQFQVIYLHYAERAPIKRKINTAKLSKRRYYDLIDRAHRVIRRHLLQDTPPTHWCR